MDPSRTPTDRSRVLVVDDEQAVREILAEGLSSFGFQAETAADAVQALAAVRDRPIGMVLSDIDMPDTNGIELLKLIKALNEDLDVVMVTGVVDAETAVKAIRDGASDYVTKPFNLEEVRIVVERTFEKRRLIRQNRAYQKELEIRKQELERKVKERTREIRRLYGEVKSSYESTLQALVTALDFRDNETQGHSIRVVEYAVKVARVLGVDGQELTSIRRGSLLHDVGKIGVPDAILRKPGKLDDHEWAEMKKHPEIGYQMLREIRFLEPALDIVLCHQERWDGSGYPRGLRGTEIPLGARIFAAVDTFDAMTSDRPYRAALSIEDAREEVRRFSGTQFDPDVAQAFLAIPAEHWRKIREEVHRKVLAMEHASSEAVRFGPRGEPSERDDQPVTIGSVLRRLGSQGR